MVRCARCRAAASRARGGGGDRRRVAGALLVACGGAAPGGDRRHHGGVAARDDAASARAYLRGVGVGYPNRHDAENTLAARYKVSGLPVTVVVGRDGRIARPWFGAIGDEQLVAYVDEIAR